MADVINALSVPISKETGVPERVPANIGDNTPCNVDNCCPVKATVTSLV